MSNNSNNTGGDDSNNSCLSYTKAILDYKLATQHEDKIRSGTNRLVRAKIYIPSEYLFDQWKVARDCVKIEKTLRALAKELGSLAEIKIVNNRFKLAGSYCVRLYYGEGICFPADPNIVQGDPGEFLDRYDQIFSAYNVSKQYTEKVRDRITVLKDDSVLQL